MCVRTRKRYCRRVAAKTRSVDTGLRAWAGLLRVHAALVPALDAILQREAAIPLGWYDVLLELNAATPGRRLLMSELGDRVVLSRTRVSRVVDELERAGYVQRQPHPTDRRSTYAVLAPAGRQRLRAAAPVYLDAIEEHFVRHLTAPELAVLAGALERVVSAAESTALR